MQLCNFTLCYAIHAGLAFDAWHGLLCGTLGGGGAAEIQVGKSALTLPYSCKLGLGVQDISIAVGTGADLITSSAGSGTNFLEWLGRRSDSSGQVGVDVAILL